MGNNKLKAVLEQIIADFLPQKCLSCEEFSQDVLCSKCQTALIAMPLHCRTCSNPVQNFGDLCGRCLKYPPVIDFFAAKYRYGNKIRDVILAAKFAHNRRALDFLSLTIKDLAFENRADFAFLDEVFYLLPLPISRPRLQERSYNQTHYLAAELAKEQKITLVKHFLRRKHRLPQSEMESRKARKRNLRDAFYVSNAAKTELNGKNILLIDDVATTFATISEAAKCLREECSVKQIAVLTCAATVL
ncbi:MAG: ComF family protein [Cardiobacteriaceae bacterium]|nr:ComF family protein [Cardiobacteriaceae bacterium]